MNSKLIKISFFSLLGLMILVNSCEQLQRIYSIDNNKCIRCSACIPTCGYGAISVDTISYMTTDSIYYTNTFTIDPKKCVGCGECRKKCPVDAISSNLRDDEETTSKSTNSQSTSSTTSGTTTGSTSAITYAVTSSRCTGCRHCLNACSVGAISMSGGKAVINAQKCTGCGKCVSYCPKSAIHQN